ncbi:hypothetical protein E6O75_ATG09739 [Venturia nashicola]|uniref:Uncharacterized protein n=1 Tax=Venturia nashicola TaxID=86259 RepID=A0A4Z1NMP1_9PEZI|nr:hypothetical protein E6O75_ATG09739 [Venturia nashicola]
MSAADLGRRLLSASVKKNLGETLCSFQLQCHTPYPSPALEELFHIDATSNHGGEHQLHSPLRKFPIIELCSEESGTGKTQLLYFITAIAILPDIYSDHDLGGRSSAMVVMDTEGRFDIQRLAEVMKGYVLSKSASCPDIDDLILRSLQHVHIYQPQNLASLITTLSSLQSHLFAEAERFRRPLHSIMIDTTSAFYWQNRAELDDLSTTISTTTTPHLQNPYATLMHHLRTLSQTFKCSIVTTSHAFSSKSKETGDRILRTLPAPWSSLPTTRLLLSRDPVRKFPMGVSAEEALREQTARMEAMRKAGFSAYAFGGSRVFRAGLNENKQHYCGDFIDVVHPAWGTIMVNPMKQQRPAFPNLGNPVMTSERMRKEDFADQSEYYFEIALAGNRKWYRTFISSWVS